MEFAIQVRENYMWRKALSKFDSSMAYYPIVAIEKANGTVVDGTEMSTLVDRRVKIRAEEAKVYTWGATTERNVNCRIPWIIEALDEYYTPWYSWGMSAWA